MKYFALLLLVLAAGCTQQQVSTDLQYIQNDIQMGTEATAAVNAIVTAAAPGTNVAKAVQKANVQVQHVNGVVQKITITVPSTPVVPAQ